MADSLFIVPPKNLPFSQTWMYEAFRRLNARAGQASLAIAAIGRNEAPDGSGAPLIDLTRFFYLPGRQGGQEAFQIDYLSPALTIKQLNPTATAEPLLVLDSFSKLLRLTTQSFTVTNCTLTISDASVSTISQFIVTGGPSVVPGMLVTGTGVPSGTYVRTLPSSTTLTMTQAATASGTVTLTFTTMVDVQSKTDDTGRDIEWLARGAVRFTTGTDGIPLRINGEVLAIASGIAAAPRVFLETGYLSSGSAVGTDFQIGGPQHGELSHMNVWTRTLWFARNPASGTNPNFSMGSLNPAEFGTVAAGFGPGSTLIVNIGANSGSAQTLFGDGSSATVLDIFSGVSGGVVTGSSPNKAIDRTLFLARFQSNGRFWLGNGAAGSVYQTGGNDIWTLFQGSNGAELMQVSRVAAWSDSLAVANSFYHTLGTLASTHRAMFLSSSGFGVFTRFGISSQYTLLSNGAAGGANFPAPDGAGSPTILRLYNAATGGFDASVLLKLESARASQSGDFLQVILQSAAVPFKLQSTGKMVTTVAPQIDTAAATTGDVWTATDNDGNGDWAAPSGGAGSGKPQYLWKGNGPFIVGTSVDGGINIPTAFTITSIRVWRGTAGTSGDTILDVHKNGTTIYTTQGNRPTVNFAAGNNALVTATAPDVTAVAAGDYLTVDIDQIEGGTPLDFTLIIEGT